MYNMLNIEFRNPPRLLQSASGRPQNAAPHQAAPHQAAPHQAAPHQAAPHHAGRIMPPHISHRPAQNCINKGMQHNISSVSTKRSS